MQVVLGAVVGLVVGYVGRWAQMKWIDDPRARRMKREEAMGEAAKALYPALEPLRRLSDGRAIVADPSGNNWWPEIDETLDAFLERYQDEWQIDMKDDVPVQARVMNLYGSSARATPMSDNPPHVIQQHVNALTKQVEGLDRLLLRRSKGDWKR